MSEMSASHKASNITLAIYGSMALLVSILYTIYLKQLWEKVIQVFGCGLTSKMNHGLLFFLLSIY